MYLLCVYHEFAFQLTVCTSNMMQFWNIFSNADFLFDDHNARKVLVVSVKHLMSLLADLDQVKNLRQAITLETQL